MWCRSQRKQHQRITSVVRNDLVLIWTSLTVRSCYSLIAFSLNPPLKHKIIYQTNYRTYLLIKKGRLLIKQAIFLFFRFRCLLNLTKITLTELMYSRDSLFSCYMRSTETESKAVHRDRNFRLAIPSLIASQSSSGIF